jgi:YjbE family integral membrane protein
MSMTFDMAFWIGMLQIIGIDIVLSGDNAVVIALASRSLPRDQQRRAIAIGTIGAVVMRVALAAVALELLRLPYLKLVGGGMLLWIGVKLLLPEDADGEDIAAGQGLFAAIRTIMIADLVMSLDNVIAVAAAAKGSVPLLVAGLALSIPLVIFGSTLLLRLIERFPMIVMIGAGILGYVAGEMMVTDPALREWIAANAPWMHLAAPLAGAALVCLAGKWLAGRGDIADSGDLCEETVGTTSATGDGR